MKYKNEEKNAGEPLIVYVHRNILTPTMIPFPTYVVYARTARKRVKHVVVFIIYTRDAR